MQLTGVLQGSLLLHPSQSGLGEAEGDQAVGQGWAFPPSRDHSVGSLCARVPVWTERDNLSLFFPTPPNSRVSDLHSCLKALAVRSCFFSLLFIGLCVCVRACVCVCVCVCETLGHI